MLKEKLTGISRRDLFKLTKAYGITSTLLAAGSLTGIVTFQRLAPIADSIGVIPIHFAVIFLVDAFIGFITLPYGLNLYVTSGVTGIPYLKIVPYEVPYLVSLLAVWILAGLVPQLSRILLFYEGANTTQ